MSKLVGLDGKAAEPPDPGIVAFLEELLGAARRGQINSIAAAYTTPGLVVGADWCRSDSSTWLAVVGATSVLHHKVLRDGADG